MTKKKPALLSSIERSDDRVTDQSCSARHDTVFVIDPDVKRRASISFGLNGKGVRAEPFETIAEFAETLPRVGTILVFDAGTAISAVNNEVARRQTLLPMVAYSEKPQPMQIVDAVLAGASGYIDWPNSTDSLLHVLRSVTDRMTPPAVVGSRKATALGLIEKLTSREREILVWMCEGLNNRQMASHLHISPRTVELHRSNMLGKLEARSSADAIRMAIESSLAQPTMHAAAA